MTVKEMEIFQLANDQSMTKEISKMLVGEQAIALVY
jgi:hypothetical protein